MATLSDAAGNFGSAQEFAGADAVTVPSSGFDDNIGSLECWVNFTGTGGNDNGTILRIDGANPSTYHLLQRVGGNGVQYLVYDGQHQYVVNSLSNTLTGWHHVLATHTTASGGKIELFIDGVSQGTAGYSATTSRSLNCRATPTETESSTADLNIVLSNYGKTVPAGVDGWSRGDFDGNGAVNGAELNMTLLNNNQSVPRVAAQLCVGGYVNGGLVSRVVGPHRRGPRLVVRRELWRAAAHATAGRRRRHHLPAPSRRPGRGAVGGVRSFPTESGDRAVARPIRRPGHLLRGLRFSRTVLRRRMAEPHRERLGVSEPVDAYPNRDQRCAVALLYVAHYQLGLRGGSRQSRQLQPLRETLYYYRRRPEQRLSAVYRGRLSRRISRPD